MTRIQKIYLLFVFLIIACAGDGSKSITETESDELGSLSLTDLNQQPFDLKKYKGKTVFINFWATWCKPCIREMPSIQKAQNILQNEKIVFLLASNESIKQIQEYKIKHNYEFNYLRIENSEDLNIQALPTTYIFDPSGILVFSEAGDREWDTPTNIDMILKIVKQHD